MKKHTTDMYKLGYENTRIFVHIPDFKNKIEKKDFERGLKDGYAIRNKREIAKQTRRIKCYCY